MARTRLEERKRRERSLRPIFSTLEQQGRSRVWLARQLQMPDTRLWTYEHGVARVPVGFVERACHVLQIPPDLVLQHASDDLVQRPRKRRAESEVPHVDTPR